jgi:plastocyanin
MKKMTLITTIVIGLLTQTFAGEISGKISFEGKTPRMKKLKLEADPICVSNNEVPPAAEWLIVDESGGVKNMIVSVKEGLSGSHNPPSEKVVLDQQGCVYRPHVLAVMAGQNVDILNNDGIMHNIHALPTINREFNKAMPKFKKKITTQFENSEKPFKIKCDVHPWMIAYIGVFDHPFFAVTGDDGTYSISGLSPGEYVIEAWHEKLGTQTATVTVGDGSATADFTFKKPSKKK